MTCSEVQACLSLYLYGELDFANEELVEVHVDECAFCQLALNREKEWHAAANKQQRDVRPEWLAECRAQLHGQIVCEPTSAAHARHRIAAWCRGFFDFRTTERSYRLAAVSFLVLFGFGAGRMMDAIHLPWGQRAPFTAAGFIQPSITQVQAIQPQPDNRVRIIVQQVQIHEVLGSRNDDGVRALLVGAARESADPGVRMDSVEMLEGQSGLEIRDAIVNTVRNDPNAAVRVQAIQGLRRLQSDSVTRGALEFVLAHDRDAGVRAMAMDALVPAQGDFEVTPQLMQTISDVMRSSQGDDYIHLRCAQILHGQAASNGIY